MPRHKTPLISILTLKSSHFRPLHKNQIKTDPPHWNEVISTHHTTSKSISSYTGIKSSSIPHTKIKSIWTTQTKTKSPCILTLKTIDFRPAYKIYRSTSTTRTTTKSISSSHWKQVKSDHPHWDQVNFDHDSKNQFNFSMLVSKTSNFDPHTKPCRFWSLH